MEGKKELMRQLLVEIKSDRDAYQSAVDNLLNSQPPADFQFGPNQVDWATEMERKQDQWNQAMYQLLINYLNECAMYLSRLPELAAYLDRFNMLANALRAHFSDMLRNMQQVMSLTGELQAASHRNDVSSWDSIGVARTNAVSQVNAMRTALPQEYDQVAAVISEVESFLQKSIQSLEVPCSVPRLKPLVGLAPNFEDEARKTEGRGVVHWENTDPKLKPAADKLVALIKGKRGTAYIESAWRPQEYQDHLYDVWTTNGELMKDTNPACDELRKIVKNEIELHHLGGVVGQHSPHTSGIAVDIPFSLTNGDIDELANSVGLWRPLFQTYPGERDHFELKQLKPYNCLCTHCNYSWSSNSPPTSCLRCGSSEVVCN